MTTYPGNLFVVAAPSGAGKSSLVKALMELDAGVQPSVSHTTRAPRGQEFHGREYFFITNDEFDRMVADAAFLEWAHVHGNRYGTSRATIEERIAKGMDVILEIDFQGALRSRLQRRGEDSPEVIELRLENAAQEMAKAHEFDFVIINQLFDTALFDLKAIVHAQRLKYASQRRSRSDIFQALNLT